MLRADQLRLSCYSAKSCRLRAKHRRLSCSSAPTGFVDEQKQFPRQRVAFSVDGIGTVAGSLMGTSPIATYIESASGIREGGRTGLTALTAAFYFMISLFFVPILCAP